MSIDNAIEKMEETLRKKKVLRADKDKSRLATLEGRVKTKTAKVKKIQSDIDSLKMEMERVMIRIHEEEGNDESVDREEPTEPFKPAVAAEG